MVAEAEKGTRTIVFTDTVASTELRSTLGDDAADVLRREHDRILRRSVDDHHGLFAKGTGDGMMAVFVSAADAVECAVDLQERMQGYRRRSQQPVEIRIGYLGDSNLIARRVGPIHGHTIESCRSGVDRHLGRSSQV